MPLVHQHLAVDGMVRGLMTDEPELASDVLLGARILSEGGCRAGRKSARRTGGKQ